MDWQDRTVKLIGTENKRTLQQSSVAIVGVGGVGSYAMEMLCRAGIGHLILIDGDTVNITNINRQLISTTASVGENKAKVAERRCKEINPDIKTEVYDIYLGESDEDKVMLDNCDYVVDAIDSVPAKISLICHCMKKSIKIISSMGAAGRMDPCKISYADISKTFGCPLARTIRTKLREKGINKGLNTVFSSEKAVSLGLRDENGNKALGTISYLPAIFGCYAAAWVIRDLCETMDKQEETSK